MKRLKLVISFDGTRLHGFQVQKNHVSVQSELNRAFQILCKCPVPVCGCSRTDAGVHARIYHCHADVPDTLNEKALVKSLNALLPDDISVYEATVAQTGYHARYSVRTKTYRYYFWNAQSRNPLLSGRACQIPFALDLDKMLKEAQTLLGPHDFAAMQSAGGKAQSSTVRTVTSVKLDPSGFPLCFFEITANGFLYHMVRNLAGALFLIGRGKEARSMAEILSARTNPARLCAPACGLYLWDIEDN